MTKNMEKQISNLTPKEIVKELDKYIIGQDKAKRSVAVALRNRYRRFQLREELKEEIIPKNILMIGPTGVGKTEIARRLARITGAPFVKVEATKFTEVGYVGRDVESMVRDLLETSIRMVKTEKINMVQVEAKELAEDRIVKILVPSFKKQVTTNPFEALSGLFSAGNQTDESDDLEAEMQEDIIRDKRENIKYKLLSGQLENTIIEIEVDDSTPQMLDIYSGAGIEQMGINMQDMMGNLFPKKKKKRKLKIKEAREILINEEAHKLLDMDEINFEAIKRAEELGIIFIDEIDKIASKERGPDVSREGVQRDILPIVEGSTVMTKYGAIKTDYVLFIGAGAFHISKPSDLIPELQGRFPVRVELDSLSKEDFIKILKEPQNALIKQYIELLAVEDIELVFTDEAIDRLAELAEDVNHHNENIGARRLHTLLEKLLEDLSFEAPDINLKTITITPEYVDDKLKDIAQNQDLSQYIL